MFFPSVNQRKGRYSIWQRWEPAQGSDKGDSQGDSHLLGPPPHRSTEAVRKEGGEGRGTKTIGSKKTKNEKAG